MHIAGRGKGEVSSSGKSVAGLIKPSKLFRLVRRSDLIVTMTHNRYEEDVNLLSCLPLFSCHCVYIIMNGERGGDKEGP